MEDFDLVQSKLAQYGARLDGEVREDQEVKVGCFRAIDGVMISITHLKQKEDMEALLDGKQPILNTSTFSESIIDAEKQQRMDEIKEILRNLKI